MHRREAKTASHHAEIQPSKRSTVNRGFSEQLGRSQRQFDAKCLLMKVLRHRHHPSAELQNQQTVSQHKVGVTLSFFDLESSIDCSSEYASEYFESSNGSTQL